MRVPRIFHPEPLHDGLTASLSADSVQHLVKVLRMSEGQPVTLFTGDGYDYHAVLTAVSKRSAAARVQSVVRNASESPTWIHLGQVISRGDRMDFVLQKSVELGVSELTPLFSERCGVKLSGERLEKKQQQWQKIVIGACEQSGRSLVPTVNKPVALEQFTEQADSGLKLTLDPLAELPLSELTRQSADLSQVRLLIGPEGGFSQTEVEHARQNHYQPMRLGPRILRTETAALTALSLLQYQLGDLA
ncbi:16S rRNA (uracil(1498)-N(3))-methyltransferase [Idiomarina seosinensis]|uniref:16S rRNA (uracil(1498)-N(3))-methyltransferase n=1 Tax=Idiomarina seosinensis TaxID=281739 RepID=UPI0038503AD5